MGFYIGGKKEALIGNFTEWLYIICYCRNIYIYKHMECSGFDGAD